MKMTKSVVHGIPWKVHSYSAGKEIPCLFESQCIIFITTKANRWKWS